MTIKLPPCWFSKLQNDLETPHITDLKEFMKNENQAGKIIYPPSAEIFNAFNLCLWDQVKVVILGQDPYHGTRQAHGLSFSVNKDVAIPPSLRNIYKELKNNFPSYPTPTHGNLSKWAQQGVLLLNTTLTVEAQKAGSHQKKGWEQFTDAVIEKLASEKENLVFIFWGSYAQKKSALISPNKHLILTSVHPSPLSAHQGNGFWHQNHFKKTNDFLENTGQKKIDWKID